MSVFLGRPPIYKNYIELLDFFGIYTPATIAMIMVEMGNLGGHGKVVRQRAYRIRIALTRVSHSRSFPTRGDGTIMLDGQRPIPGWYGWRWKKIYEEPRAYMLAEEWELAWDGRDDLAHDIDEPLDQWWDDEPPSDGGETFDWEVAFEREFTATHSEVSDGTHEYLETKDGDGNEPGFIEFGDDDI